MRSFGRRSSELDEKTDHGDRASEREASHSRTGSGYPDANIYGAPRTIAKFDVEDWYARTTGRRRHRDGMRGR